MSDTTTDSVVRVSGPINAAGLEMTLETGRFANLADGAVTVRSATPPCCRPCARRSPAKASTSSRSPSTSKSACTPRARSPARSSGVKAGPGEHAILTAASPTVRCGRRSRPTSATRCRSSRPSSVSTSRTRTTSRRSTARRRRSPCRASRSTVRSAPCASRTTNGAWIAHPTFQEGDESTFEIVVAGRKLDDGDVAIMMVEAGGTENSWELYEQGAPKVTEEMIAEGLEEAKRWIAASIDLQTQLREDVEKAHGPIEPIEYLPGARLHARDLRRGEAARRGAHRRGDDDRRQDRAQHAARRDRGRDAGRRSSAPSTRPAATPKRRPR